MSAVTSVNVYDVDVAGLPVLLQHPEVLWVQARSDLRRIYALAGDILAALGKDRSLSGKGRSQQEDIALATAWMRAYGTSDLVVVNSELLHPIILTGLARLAHRAEVNLWLLHKPPISDTVHKRIKKLSTAVDTYDNVPQPTEKKDCSEVEESDPSCALAPRADFPSFLAALDALPSQPRSQMERVFFDQHDQVAADLSAAQCTLHAGREATTSLLCRAPSDDELIAGIRGLQVAAWHQDVFVDVDLNVLLTSEERPTITHEQADQCLAAYRQPHRAIAVALTMRHIGIDRVAELTIADTNAAGDITIDGATLPSNHNLQCAIRAQRLLRIATGAADTDPLLDYAPARLATFVNNAAVDLGIRAAGRRIERRSDQTRWLKSLGITVCTMP